MICMSCHSYTLHQSVASAPQSNDTHSQIRVGWTIVSSANLKTSPICSMAILVGSPEQVSRDLLTCQGEVLQDGVPLLVTSTH